MPDGRGIDDNMLKVIHLGRLAVLMCIVSFCAQGQTVTVKDITQDTEIARHEMQIAQVEDRTLINTQRIDKMNDSINDLRIEIAQAKYAVYGFGVCLTFLQALQVLAAFKKPKTEQQIRDDY